MGMDKRRMWLDQSAFHAIIGTSHRMDSRIAHGKWQNEDNLGFSKGGKCEGKCALASEGGVGHGIFSRRCVSTEDN